MRISRVYYIVEEDAQGRVSDYATNTSEHRKSMANYLVRHLGPQTNKEVLKDALYEIFKKEDYKHVLDALKDLTDREVYGVIPILGV